MEAGELRAWVAVNSIPGIGARTFRRLIAAFGSATEVLQAPLLELVGRGRLDAEQANRVAETAAQLDRVEQQINSLREAGIEILALPDPGYPTNLRGIGNSPPVLYVWGQLQPEDDLALAMVGTRTPSPQGLDLARLLAAEFARRGITVVSGLALGIDTAAHRGAIDGGGRTLAVLGGGIREVRPVSNRPLAEQISSCGAVVSELEPDDLPSRENLIARNRIIAGLARAVLVVQARRRGGSLVAASHALRYGRRVFGVAWDDPQFKAGAEKLTSQGATLISGPSDVDLVVNELEAFVLDSPGSDQDELF